MALAKPCASAGEPLKSIPLPREDQRQPTPPLSSLNYGFSEPRLRVANREWTSACGLDPRTQPLCPIASFMTAVVRFDLTALQLRRAPRSTFASTRAAADNRCSRWAAHKSRSSLDRAVVFELLPSRDRIAGVAACSIRAAICQGRAKRHVQSSARGARGHSHHAETHLLLVGRLSATPQDTDPEDNYRDKSENVCTESHSALWPRWHTRAHCYQGERDVWQRQDQKSDRDDSC
jgi:hypothetical protein